jgi:RNA polymerase sigma factor (sigma-70 family)
MTGAGDRSLRRANPRMRGDEQVLFQQHASRLSRVVQGALRVRPHIVEEACAFAWLQLVRTQPERQQIFAWLRVVATHEALRLLREEGRQEPTAGANLEADDLADFVFQVSVDATSEERRRACEALELIAALPEREARIFARHVAGYTYEEISAETGDSLRTVERQLVRARGRIRGADD